jgi:hypothetical protein
MTKRVQAGDTNELAVAFALLPDPDPERVASSVRGSWGRFELWVAGRNLTEHRDRAEGLHEAVTWYLRPAIRWLVGLRQSVLRDLAPPLPVRVDRGTEYLAHAPAPEWIPEAKAQRRDQSLWRWRQRHALSAARRGGIFPEIVFRRVGDEVEISWDADRAPSRSGSRFLEARGGTSITPTCFERILSELEDLSREIIGAVGGGAPADGDENLRVFLEEELANTNPEWLIDRDQQLGPVGLVAQGLDPDLSRDDARALVELAAEPGGPMAINAVAETAAEPWEDGYQAALALRNRLGLDGTPLRDVPDLLRSLGVRARPIELHDPAVRSIATFGPDLGAGAVVGWNRTCSFNDTHSGRGASLLQGLGHLLLDRTRAGRVGFPHGSDWTGRRTHRRANAFAAMMLAPPDALRGLEPTLESLREHCQRLSTSPQLLARHAANLGILDSGVAEALIDSEGAP